MYVSCVIRILLPVTHRDTLPASSSIPPTSSQANEAIWSSTFQLRMAFQKESRNKTGNKKEDVYEGSTDHPVVQGQIK